MHRRHLLRLLGLTMLAAVSVMAVSASAAQAKYLLLLNKTSVKVLKLTAEILPGYMKSENGLKVECTGGTGNATGTLSESAEKVAGNASVTFTGCKWAGNKFCTINDGGVGLIKATGEGEVTMPGPGEYLVQATSAAFTTIKTEGELCTIPEKEVVSGTASIQILNAEDDTTKVKLAHLKNVSLMLGKSKVTELVGEAHVFDEDKEATWGISLINLP